MVLTFEIAREKFLKIRDDSIAELDKVFPPPEDSRHHEVPAKLPKNSIPVFQEMLAHDDAAIINSDPIELLDQLAKAKVSAVAVAGAFLRAAVIAQTLTNCLTELLPREALETAQKLDDYLKSTGKPVGSSSGEGAIVGLGASVLGLGTDIGGSIRGPAACCGVYGLRPSVGRITNTGCDYVMHGADSIKACIGPLTSSPKLLELFMKVMSDAEVWRYDPFTERSMWNPALFQKKKLRVGYYADDGYVTPHPPVIRAVNEYLDKIKKLSFKHVEIELVPFTPYDPSGAVHIISSLYFPDGGKELKEELSSVGESLTEMSKMALNNPSVQRFNIEELWKAHTQRDTFRWNLMHEWTKAGIDMLITPVLPGAAFKFGTCNYWGYTAYWNLADYTSVSVPYSSVKASDKPVEDFKPRNKLDAEWQALYSPETYEGAPLSIQLIAPRMQDEVVVEALKLFSDIN
ncbi:amidase signature domain-containing protein [Yarrowia lipolytica]|nr:amidase signature domain-containing protein [Yarrowia lipolytica]RDW42680.1 amidase signature domain-containing protein [Yarrowia lipolytica]RMI97717.1 amidase signature domain-containing protein [Yarrowia lipolytica]